MSTPADYALLIVVTLFVLVFSINVYREHRREKQRWIGLAWRAVSPSAQFIVATADELEAVKLVASVGKVSFIDREQRIIFFDTQLGGENSAPGASSIRSN